MAVDKGAAASVADKLVDFRNGLKPDEQEALDNLLDTFKRAFKHIPDGVGLLGFPEGQSPLDVIRDEVSKRAPEPEGDPFIGPTITTITIVTTIASHPIITCR